MYLWRYCSRKNQAIVADKDFLSRLNEAVWALNLNQNKSKVLRLMLESFFIFFAKNKQFYAKSKQLPNMLVCEQIKFLNAIGLFILNKRVMTSFWKKPWNINKFNISFWNCFSIQNQLLNALVYLMNWTQEAVLLHFDVCLLRSYPPLDLQIIWL